MIVLLQRWSPVFGDRRVFGRVALLLLPLT